MNLKNKFKIKLRIRLRRAPSLSIYQTAIAGTVKALVTVGNADLFIRLKATLPILTGGATPWAASTPAFSASISSSSRAPSSLTLEYKLSHCSSEWGKINSFGKTSEGSIGVCLNRNPVMAKSSPGKYIHIKFKFKTIKSQRLLIKLTPFWTPMKLFNRSLISITMSSLPPCLSSTGTKLRISFRKSRK